MCHQGQSYNLNCVVSSLDPSPKYEALSRRTSSFVIIQPLEPANLRAAVLKGAQFWTLTWGKLFWG